MKATLGEVKALVWSAVLVEDTDFVKLMSRTLRNGKRIVALDGGGLLGEEALVLVTDDNVVVAAISADARNNKWSTIDTLWANTASDAVAIVMAALAHWKRIKPSNDVSPAARAIIKRYYDDNKDDPTLVTPLPAIKPGYMDAGYTAPPGLYVKVTRAHGPKQAKDFALAVSMGFQKAYVSAKTGFDDFSKLAKQQLWPDLRQALDSALHNQTADSAKQAALQWVENHPQEMEHLPGWSPTTGKPKKKGWFS